VNKRLCFLFTVVTVVPVALLGQEKSQAPAAPPANPITASERGLYSFVSNAVIGAAQKMPEKIIPSTNTGRSQFWPTGWSCGRRFLHVLLASLG
jgi:hypothetical protein